jgi:hypothetical protein
VLGSRCSRCLPHVFDCPVAPSAGSISPSMAIASGPQNLSRPPFGPYEIPAPRSPAARAREPSPIDSRPTKPIRRRNAAAIDASPRGVYAPRPPPSVPRSCVPPAATAPRNIPSTVRPDPRNRAPSPKCRHGNKTRLTRIARMRPDLPVRRHSPLTRIAKIANPSPARIYEIFPTH